MADYQVWARLNNGNWNGNPSADPVTGVGGIDLSAMIGTTMFPTAQGTGDAETFCNFGASAFSQAVPSGYTAGWPAAAGGFTTLDATKLHGSASLVTPLHAKFISTAGVAQAVDGYTTGQYYFEMGLTGDSFSADEPGGVGRDFNDGGDYTFWFGGEFSSINTLGGMLVTGNSISSQSSIAALGSTVVPNVFGRQLTGADIVCFAVFLTAGTPPPPSKQQATLAELWLATTSGFVDLSVESNRRKFISVAGGTTNLGTSGQNPFGVTPPVYLSSDGNPPSFATNNGRGGAFIISAGTLTDGGHPPGSTSSMTSLVAPTPGKGLLGDYRNGNLYAFNPATLTDNGTQRKWVRRWRALAGNSFATIKFDFLAIDMQTGIGVPEGTNPQLVLRWSDDGGHTWGPERFVPAGRLGETKKTIKFNRLGSTRRFSGSTRIYELSSTDPFSVVLLDAEVDAS